MFRRFSLVFVVCFSLIAPAFGAVVLAFAAAPPVVAATTGALSQVSAIANLVGIAVATLVFKAGGKQFSLDIGGADLAMNTDPSVSEVVEGDVPSGSTLCSLWVTVHYRASNLSTGTSCPSKSVQLAPANITWCNKDLNDYAKTGSITGEYGCPSSYGSQSWYRNYYKKVDGSSVAYHSIGRVDSFPSGSTSDNHVHIPLAGTGYSPKEDPDLTPGVGGASVTPAFTSGGSIYLQSQDSNNQLSVTKVTPSASGVAIQEYSQVSAGQVRQTNANIAPNGVVQSATQNYYQGEVQNVPASSTNFVPDYNPVSNPTQNPAPDGSTSPGTGGSTTVQFPSDYARTGEASSAATQLSESLLDGEIITPEVPDTDMPWFGNTFDGVSGFHINTAGATCPVWQFNALDEGFYIDHHCNLISDFNALFYAMFTAFWLLLGFRTVMEA